MSLPTSTLPEAPEPTSVGVARLDGAGRVRLANEALCQLLGGDPTGEELAGFAREDQRPALRAWLDERRQGADGPAPHTAEHELVPAVGGARRVLLSAEPRRGGDDVELLVQVSAVPDLVRAVHLHDAQRRVLELVAGGAPLQQVLDEVVRRAQELQPGVRASVMRLSDDGRTLHVASAPDLPAFFREALEGLPAQEGMGCCGTTAATGQAQIAADVQTHPHWAAYQDLVAGAGVRACWSEPILSAGGRVLGTFAFFHHVPARPGPADLDAIHGLAHLLAVAIERELAERSRARLADDLHATLDSLGDAVVVLDGQGRVRELNDAGRRLLGDGALGRSAGEVLDLAARGGDDRPVDALALAARAPEGAEPVTLTTPDGEQRIVSVGGARLPRLAHEPDERVLVLRDVTAEVELAERLRHASKMEAIGELAGGVAHDFNNLLTGVLANGELLRADLDGEQGHMVDQILVAADRAAQLTSQLLSFSRRGRLRTMAVDVHGLVAELVDLLRHSIDPRIELEQQLHARETVVMGDPAELHNALLNLCLNARDAMPEGGRLTLATRSLELGPAACDELANEASLSPGLHIEVNVRDTGQGMTREVAARVFEPYFTTKSPGEGTGLGLSSVYGCVHSHQGLIDVRSSPGHGSSFRVLLPVSAEAGRAPADVDSRLPRGSGHVLLVDDEALVRVATRKALEELGYRVSTCQDGAQALELLVDRGQAVDLVLLDMVMPRVDGLDTLRGLRAAGVDVPVVLCTGHTDRRRAQAALDEGALMLVSKPFRLAELAGVVARHCRPAAD